MNLLLFKNFFEKFRNFFCIILVAESFDSESLKAVQWLSGAHGVDICCIRAMLEVEKSGSAAFVSFVRAYPSPQSVRQPLILKDATPAAAPPEDEDSPDLQALSRQLADEAKDRRRAEGALREIEQRYRMLSQLAPVGFFHTDAKGNFLYVNERWCEISGRWRRIPATLGCPSC